MKKTELLKVTHKLIYPDDAESKVLPLNEEHKL